MTKPASRDNREASDVPSPGSTPTEWNKPIASIADSAASDTVQTTPRRRSTWLVWISVFGPGIIAAAAGNDAGGIATYSQAGAQYGLNLLWCLAIITVGLIFVQEMCSRMGAVTGKGLAGLIRENFGVKITFFAMIALVLANFALIVSEFAGIAAVGDMFGISRYYVVPAAMLVVWLLVSRGSFQKVERIFIVASGVFVVYIITALKQGVPWHATAIATFLPETIHPHPKFTPVLLAMVVALIGTTISPYMQFYQQAAVRDKGITMKDYAYARADTIFGCVLSNVVAAFIIITCAVTLNKAGITNISNGTDAAQALAPLAGKLSTYLFAFGLLNASLMAAVVVPLSSAYAVTEALGWESGMGRRIRELPLFYGTYGIMILLGGIVVIALPKSSNLFQLILGAQAINCLLLPVELILMLVLVNRRRVMGKDKNTFWDNVGGWTTAVVAGVLSIVYLVWHPS